MGRRAFDLKAQRSSALHSGELAWEGAREPRGPQRDGLTGPGAAWPGSKESWTNRGRNWASGISSLQLQRGQGRGLGRGWEPNIWGITRWEHAVSTEGTPGMAVQVGKFSQYAWFPPHIHTSTHTHHTHIYTIHTTTHTPHHTHTHIPHIHTIHTHQHTYTPPHTHTHTHTHTHATHIYGPPHTSYPNIPPPHTHTYSERNLMPVKSVPTRTGMLHKKEPQSYSDIWSTPGAIKGKEQEPGTQLLILPPCSAQAPEGSEHLEECA